jgi:hypothetical protein
VHTSVTLVNFGKTGKAMACSAATLKALNILKASGTR